MDRDGFLTKEEFQPLISNEVLTTWLHTLDIDTYDLSMVFPSMMMGMEDFPSVNLLMVSRMSKGQPKASTCSS